MPVPPEVTWPPLEMLSVPPAFVPPTVKGHPPYHGLAKVPGMVTVVPPSITVAHAGTTPAIRPSVGARYLTAPQTSRGTFRIGSNYPPPRAHPSSERDQIISRLN
jgi:hypothetical protein